MWLGSRGGGSQGVVDLGWWGLGVVVERVVMV